MQKNYINERNFISSKFDLTNKELNISILNKNFINKLVMMAKVNNLPLSCDERELKIALLTEGFLVFTDKADNKLRYFIGSSLGNEISYNYEPTHATIANPALHYNATLKITTKEEDGDCVVVNNDYLRTGILPILTRYNTMIMENDISIYIADINNRIISLITAQDGKQKTAAEEYIKQIVNGKLGIIADYGFAGDEVIKTLPTSNSNNSLIPLIELRTYLTGILAQEFGMQAATNGKREALNDSETALGEDLLKPYIDNILECWNEGFEMINKKYGTNIYAELNSIWKENQETREAELNILEENNKENNKKNNEGSDDNA